VAKETAGRGLRVRRVARVRAFTADIELSASPEDSRLVATQLDREPRGTWCVTARCLHRRPVVIMTAPRLDDGTPFPTLFYLTCPWLVKYVSGLENASIISEWAERLATDPELRTRMIATDAKYRVLRAELAGGEDPTPDIGIAGQRSPLSTKCLHAHVATYIAGLDDPVGEALIEGMSAPCCPADLCARFL